MLEDNVYMGIRKLTLGMYFERDASSCLHKNESESKTNPETMSDAFHSIGIHGLTTTQRPMHETY